MSFFQSLFNRKEHIESDKTSQDLKLDQVGMETKKTGSIEGEADDQAIGDPGDDETEYEIVEREILPDKIICPDCGGITLEGLEFCDKCGGELL